MTGLDLVLSSIPSEPLTVLEVGLMLEPEEAFGRICRRPGSFFLDSSLAVAGLSRMSFMGCDPAAMLRVDASTTTLVGSDHVLRLTENPFDVLKGILDRFRCGRPSDAVPFCGGMVGYIGYEMSC